MNKRNRAKEMAAKRKSSYLDYSGTKSRRLTPMDKAIEWINIGVDQDGLAIEYINDIKGYGVFAKKTFEKGDFLLEYVGDLISEAEAKKREIKYNRRNRRLKYPRCFTFYVKHDGKTWCIDATGTAGRAGNLVNDSKNGNSQMKKIIVNGKIHLGLFATKKIEINNELEYDYGSGEKYWWRELTEFKKSLTAESEVDVNKDSTHLAEVDVNKDSTHLAEVDVNKDSTHLAEVDVSKDSTHLAEVDVTKDSTHLAEVDVNKDSTHLAEVDVNKDSTHLAEVDVSKDSTHLAEVDVNKDSTHLAEVDVNKDSTHLAEPKTTVLSKPVTTPLTEEVTTLSTKSLAELVTTVRNKKSLKKNNKKSQKQIEQEADVTKNQEVKSIKSNSHFGERGPKDSKQESKDSAVDCIKDSMTCSVLLDKAENVLAARAKTTFLLEAETTHLFEPETGHLTEPETACLANPEVTHVSEPVTLFLAEQKMNKLKTTLFIKPQTTLFVEPEIIPSTEPETTSLPELENISLAEPVTISLAEPKAIHFGEPETTPILEVESSLLTEPKTLSNCTETLSKMAPQNIEQVLVERNTSYTHIGEDCQMHYEQNLEEYDLDMEDFDDDVKDPDYVQLNDDSDNGDELELVPDSGSESDTMSDVYPALQSSSDRTLHGSPDTALQGSSDTTLSSVSDRELGSSDIIEVPKALKTSEGKRIYDKRHVCFYCGGAFSKISDHLENKHSCEIEVAEALAKPKKSKARKAAWAKIRQKGCFHHNVKVLAEKRGTLIVVRRPKRDQESSNFLPCSYCFGFFKSDELWRHTQDCPFIENRNEIDTSHIKKASELLLQGYSPEYSNVDSQFSNVILCSMKKDKVLEAVTSDKSLIILGTNMLKKVGISRAANVRQKLRELARLLILLRDTSNTTAIFTDFITPLNFDVIVKKVQELCNSEEIDKQRQTERGCPQYDKPTLALKLGHSLKHMAQIKRGGALRMGDTIGRKEAEDYLLLHEAEWAEKISRHAVQTISERKFNQPDILPLTEDVVKLRQFLLQEMEELVKLLSNSPDITRWRQLAQAVLCRVTVFNKRRGGETGQMLLSSYQNRRTDWQEAGNSEITSTLEPIEKSLMERLQLVEIVGKRNRKVPVLLTADMIKSIDCMLKHRAVVGIPSTNKYLFAAPSSKNGYLKGWDALHAMGLKAKLVRPELLTTTNLRKYIATVSQIVDLGSNQELEWLANHMGHTLSVHRQYYRLQEHTLELAKVSKLLIAVDAGKCNQYAGKTLNDITLDEIPDALSDTGCDEIDEEVASEMESPSKVCCDDNELSIADVEVTKPKEQVKSKPKLQKPKKSLPVKRKPWKKEESALLKQYFHKNIIEKKPPCKNDILLQGRKNKAMQSLLESRGWISVKHYVWNLAQQHHKQTKNILS